MSSRKQNKLTIECGLCDNCARHDCTFKHPDGRNLDANLRKFREEQRKKQIALQQRQMKMIGRQCHQRDSCHQLSCPYRHPPAWNPIENQRLLEEKCRQSALQREQQRQQALNVCYKESIASQNEISRCQEEKNSISKNNIRDDDEYDNEYFDVQEKVWEKQAKR